MGMKSASHPRVRHRAALPNSAKGLSKASKSSRTIFELLDLRSPSDLEAIFFEEAAQAIEKKDVLEILDEETDLTETDLVLPARDEVLDPPTARNY